MWHSVSFFSLLLYYVFLLNICSPGHCKLSIRRGSARDGDCIFEFLFTNKQINIENTHIKAEKRNDCIADFY